MTSIYGLKPKFQSLLRPAVRSLAAQGVRPNTITIAALIGSLLAGIAVSQAAREPRLLLLLPAWLLIRMALNAMDGMLAREHGMATGLGAVLNEAGDILSDIALYLPLGFLAPGLFWPALAFCCGAALTEICGLFSLTVGAGRRYEGPMGKSDRALLISCLALLTVWMPALMEDWAVFLICGAVLTLVTCLIRIARAIGAARVRPQ